MTDRETDKGREGARQFTARPSYNSALSLFLSLSLSLSRSLTVALSSPEGIMVNI